MIQRKLLLIGMLLVGIFLFIVGIRMPHFALIVVGLILSSIPATIYGFLIYNRARNHSRSVNNYKKFTTIYKLLSTKTFNNYPLNYNGSITRMSALRAYRKTKKVKNNFICPNHETRFYNYERVCFLVDSFYKSYQSPDKIKQYLFEHANYFPCDSTTILNVRNEFSEKTQKYQYDIDKLYLSLLESFDGNESFTQNLNSEILKNHKEKETTGLGFGIITNSPTHAILYSAMDADERKWQELSHRPRLSNTEESDNETLKNIYDEIIETYKNFIQEIKALLSNLDLYTKDSDSTYRERKKQLEKQLAPLILNINKEKKEENKIKKRKHLGLFYITVGCIFAGISSSFMFLAEVANFFFIILVLYGLFACGIGIYLEVSQNNTHDKKIHVLFIIFTLFILIMFVYHICCFAPLRNDDFLMNYLSFKEKIRFFTNVKELKETFPFL